MADLISDAAVSIRVGWQGEGDSRRARLHVDWGADLKGVRLPGVPNELDVNWQFRLTREQISTIPAGYVREIGSQPSRVLVFAVERDDSTHDLLRTGDGYGVVPYAEATKAAIVREVQRQRSVQHRLPPRLSPAPDRLSDGDVDELVERLAEPVVIAQAAIDALGQGGARIVPALIRHMDDHRPLAASLTVALRGDCPGGDAMCGDPTASSAVVAVVNLMLEQLTGQQMCPELHLAHPPRLVDHYFTVCEARWRLWWWTDGATQQSGDPDPSRGSRLPR